MMPQEIKKTLTIWMLIRVQVDLKIISAKNNFIYSDLLFHEPLNLLHFLYISQQ